MLKHEKFKSLCEITGYPSALCPSNPGKKEIYVDLTGQLLDYQLDFTERNFYCLKILCGNASV